MYVIKYMKADTSFFNSTKTYNNYLYYTDYYLLVINSINKMPYLAAHPALLGGTFIGGVYVAGLLPDRTVSGTQGRCYS